MQAHVCSEAYASAYSAEQYGRFVFDEVADPGEEANLGTHYASLPSNLASPKVNTPPSAANNQ